MSAPAPRIEINLGKIQHNASCLVQRLASRGVAVIGITKATLGAPAIARAFLSAGVQWIGDSRISNLRRMHNAGLKAHFVLIRCPMPSEIDAVVHYADISLNTEISVIQMLSKAASKAGKDHGILLMVEMGDLREGILPVDLMTYARAVIALPSVHLVGIGCNLACYGGVAPDAAKMTALSALTEELEQDIGHHLAIISGGNSANLKWALNRANCGRINNLRLGESILLGRETLERKAIPDLYTDAFRVVAEVIESKVKPSKPTGTIAQAAFGSPNVPTDRGDINRCLLAIGRQDCDPDGLKPPADIVILGASSDHLVIESTKSLLPIGSEVAFQPNYSALLTAMTSPYVARVFV